MKVKSVGTFGDEARIAMVVIHPVRDQDTRSEMAIIVVITVSYVSYGQLRDSLDRRGLFPPGAVVPEGTHAKQIYHA